MDKDSKGQRKLEDSGGGLLPAVEGQPRIAFQASLCYCSCVKCL